MIIDLLLALTLGQPVQQLSPESSKEPALLSDKTAQAAEEEMEVAPKAKVVSVDDAAPPAVFEESMETQIVPQGSLAPGTSVFEAWELQQWYASVDALFLWRSQATDRTFAVDSVTNTDVLNSSDIDFPLRAGVEAMLGWRLDSGTALEASYFYIGDASANAAAVSAGNTLDLAISDFGPALEPLFRGLGRVDIQATSQLWNAEFRFVHSFRDGTDSPHRFQIFAGPRMIAFDETLHLQTTNPAGEGTINETLSENTFYGGQIGARMAVRDILSFVDLEGSLAAGLYGNETFVRQSYQATMPSLGNLRLNDGPSGFAQSVDANFKLRYKLRENLHLSAGYRLLYLTEVARSTDQVPMALATNLTVDRSGDVFFHGFTAAIELQWGGLTDPNCRSGCCRPYVVNDRCCR